MDSPPYLKMQKIYMYSPATAHAGNPPLRLSASFTPPPPLPHPLTINNLQHGTSR
jgi:hypothetical protein